MNTKLRGFIYLIALWTAPLVSEASVAEQAQVGDKMNDPAVAASMIESLRAAQEYVDLLDKGRYTESWAQGAALFQKTISPQEWAHALQLARRRLGAVRSRTLKDQKPARDPAGLPKGAYMVVEFNVDFEKVKGSGELLTLMQEKNGTWKVLTYQVN